MLCCLHYKILSLWHDVNSCRWNQEYLMNHCQLDILTFQYLPIFVAFLYDMGSFAYANLSLHLCYACPWHVSIFQSLNFEEKNVCELISLWVCLSKFVLVSEFCLFLYMVVLEFMNVMLYVYVCHCYVYIFFQCLGS